MKQIFITGGTGYMGSRLIKMLLKKGYSIKALVRSGSENKLSEGCEYVIADPFDATTFAKEIIDGSIFIQLLGVSHPGPRKKKQFQTIDLASARGSITAAKEAGVKHFIYVSVAQTPTTIMHDYQKCRAEAEALIHSTKINSTIIRPWYVVGPGHYWPLFFQPFFKLMEWIPSTSKKAKALRLVTLKQMLNTLIYAVDHPPKEGVSIIEIDGIKAIR